MESLRSAAQRKGRNRTGACVADAHLIWYVTSCCLTLCLCALCCLSGTRSSLIKPCLFVRRRVEKLLSWRRSLNYRATRYEMKPQERRTIKRSPNLHWDTWYTPDKISIRHLSRTDCVCVFVCEQWSYLFLLLDCYGRSGYDLFFKTRELKKKWLEQFEMALWVSNMWKYSWALKTAIRELWRIFSS